jgi:hypothetical protein
MQQSYQFSKEKVKVDELLKSSAFQNAKAVVSVLNPADGWTYVSNEPNPEKCADIFDKPEMRAIHVGDFNKILNAHDEGRYSEGEWKDKILYGVFNKRDGWQNRAVEYQDRMKAAAASSSGGISVADYSGVEVSTMTAIIFGLQERTHVLQNGLRFIDVEGTKYEYPELTSRVTISRNITYGVDIPIKSVGIANRALDLLCDASHFAMFDDVRYRPHSVDVWRVNLEAIGVAFIRDTAEQVAELLLDSNITHNAAAGLWTDSTKNPYLDVAQAIIDIQSNNGNPDRFFTDDMVIAAFQGNVNTKGLAQPSKPINEIGAGQMAPSWLYSGIETWRDSLMTTGQGTLIDTFFFPFVRGPQGTGQYREVPRFLNGNVSFQWKRLFSADWSKARIIDTLL